MSENNKPQDKLIQLLKKKGTGPSMSKSLSEEDLEDLALLLKSTEVNLTTKATMITALLTLQPTKIEKEFIDMLNPTLSMEEPPPSNPHSLLTATLKAISHVDLSYDEFKTAITSLFDAQTPDYLKASFLEAERLKRESMDENKACFDVFWERSQHHPIDVPILIDIANAYDGFNRHHYLAPFIACLLGGCGVSDAVAWLSRGSA